MMSDTAIAIKDLGKAVAGVAEAVERLATNTETTREELIVQLAAGIHAGNPDLPAMTVAGQAISTYEAIERGCK